MRPLIRAIAHFAPWAMVALVGAGVAQGAAPIGVVAALAAFQGAGGGAPHASGTWAASSGGAWADTASWDGGLVPTSGDVVIHPQFGGTIAGPSGAVQIRSLALGAQFGRTVVDLEDGSVVIVEQPIAITADAGIAGFGVVASMGGITNSGVVAMDDLTVVGGRGVVNAPTGDIGVNLGFISGTVRNSGLIDITPDGQNEGFASLDVDGAVHNERGGMMFLRDGVTDLWSSAGFFNSGLIGIDSADAAILGAVTNIGSANGSGEYDPVGGIDISAESVVVFGDDVVNQSVITVDATSVVAVFGSLVGNGVSGPGGAGTAGALFLEGGVQPGFGAGIARFDGDVTVGSGAITTIEIGGVEAGSGHDQIVIAGVASVSGTLRVVAMDGFVPQPGHAYTVLAFGSVIGSFDAIELDEVMAASGADLSTLMIDGTIRIPAPGCAGDINGDGSTNVADFTILAGNFGDAVAANTSGDLNGDGVVNVTDFTIFAGEFGCGN